jgi:hypothetical protein
MSAPMAPIVAGDTCSNFRRTNCHRRALGFSKGEAMGKFFLILVAVSVVILLAMSAYVISL